MRAELAPSLRREVPETVLCLRKMPGGSARWRQIVREKVIKDPAARRGCDGADLAPGVGRRLDFECHVLLEAAGAVAGGGLGRSPMDRIALGDVADEAERSGALARLVFVVSICHSVKVPWATALPPDAGRTVPPRPWQAPSLPRRGNALGGV